MTPFTTVQFIFAACIEIESQYQRFEDLICCPLDVKVHPTESANQRLALDERDVFFNQDFFLKICYYSPVSKSITSFWNDDSISFLLEAEIHECSPLGGKLPSYKEKWR